MYNNSYYGSFRTRKFSQIFESEEIFTTKVTNAKIPLKISESSLQTLYYLLYARYGNSNIASMDENQFIYKLCMTIFEYGPTWEKRLEIQDALRNLSLDELKTGSRDIYNHAYNPSTVPGENEIIPTINEQNTTYRKRGDADAYGLLLSLLDTDVTGDFLSKFKPLFLAIVYPEKPLWYVTKIYDGKEEEDDD